MEVKERINNLRKLMKQRGITAYIIPTSDPHQSEYLADHYKTRVWISGFTGSAGTVVVTEDEAILWTDGRYFIQAEKELKDSGIKLYKIGIPGFPTYIEWLKDNLKEGDTVGFDGKTYAQKDAEKLEKELGKKGIKLVDEYDLVGELWADRPEPPKSKVFVHDVKYAGKTAKQKIEEVRKEMDKEGATHFLIGSLDDIAWLYNIRGRDVKNNPVVISYALISMDNAWLFVDSDKIDDEVRKHLNENGVEIEEYNKVKEYVGNIEKGSKIFLDPAMINRWLYKGIPEDCEIIEGTNITTKLKAIKNDVEIKNQRNAYIKDGVALVKFMYWLDKNVGKMEITEVSAAEKLEEFRKEQEGFIEPSFDTIAAYKENAAMMHYKAEEGKSNYKLKKEKMFLVDSGGQYFDGTTDITRTIVLGNITEEEKRDFTLTLKGHINLINARFLYGSTGSNLDTLARYPLWQEGLDYKCGTGHGVGFLLSVHEGPHSISSRPNTVTLEEGMIVTVEPGVYKEGKHGIRIENVAVIEKDINTDSGQFMKFEVLSYCPIDLDGIDVELLTEEERKWLNKYHKQVYEKLSPYLNEEEKEWLKEQTRSI
ncbi:Xaa-Pro aminopeptidase [Keratinibaculum paraultunense]|uniref:Xaa-Pro aminopeptidase n=1 Tax=Keratinibaculum paraultunense TaxID=1278232 RepID=A0A4R3L0C5_9FIRM|nr:aminopeptidase P family protein [Keratinibaculum paraultunense]QQY80054.1 aminopeptidase P family protein [Keratinibaculum paraultunense]TCS91625.1 Xaa-Pro aminopeptidase [Keratinibaculum paraultunense]